MHGAPDRMQGRHSGVAAGQASLSHGCNDAGVCFTADASVIEALRHE